MAFIFLVVLHQHTHMSWFNAMHSFGVRAHSDGIIVLSCFLVVDRKWILWQQYDVLSTQTKACLRPQLFLRPLHSTADDNLSVVARAGLPPPESLPLDPI